MLASPFFTSGRASILPSIATKDELHTANSLTQTTQWTTLTIGTFLGGASVMQFGYQWAFFGNSLSFVFSALCISRLFLPGRGFRPPRRALTETDVVRPWHEYAEGLRYMRARAADSGAGAGQRGLGHRAAARRRSCSRFSARWFSIAARPASASSGDSPAWACCAAASLAYTIGRRLSFANYKRAMAVCYVVHGGAYILFSQMRSFYWRWSSSRCRARGWGSAP